MKSNELIYEEVKESLEDYDYSDRMISIMAMDDAQKEYYNYLYHEACRLNDKNIMSFLESKEI